MGSDFAVPEATIGEIQAAYRARELSVTELVRTYLERIEQLDPALNSIVAASETALARADELDRHQFEQATHHRRAPTRFTASQPA